MHGSRGVGVKLSKIGLRHPPLEKFSGSAHYYYQEHYYL